MTGSGTAAVSIAGNVTSSGPWTGLGVLGCSAGTSTLSGPFSGAATINGTGGAVTFNTAGTLTNSALNLSGGTVVFNTTAIGSGASIRPAARSPGPPT
ncbi:MAG: hypothetical protein IPK26_13065 [Planctomycetes bacterium]|nr:hypothetical protein [Planctomycetota bacterium]